MAHPTCRSTREGTCGSAPATAAYTRTATTSGLTAGTMCVCMCVTVCEQRRQGSWGHTYTHSHPMWQQTCNQSVNTHRLLALSLGCMAVCCGRLQKTTHLAGHTQCDVSAGAPPVQHRDQDSLDAAACGAVTAATNTTARMSVCRTQQQGTGCSCQTRTGPACQTRTGATQLPCHASPDCQSHSG